MSRRAALGLVALLLASCSGSVRLDDAAVGGSPVETTAPSAPSAVRCSKAEQSAQLPTASYEPDSRGGPNVDQIRERGRLIVGVSGDTLLFGARNPLTGDIEGFDIDVLREIAVAIFGEGGDGKIEYRVITYADRIPKLEAGPDNGGVDLVAHTMTINCDRWKRIDFSSTYFLAGQKLLVTEGSDVTSLDDLKDSGVVLCAPEGSTNIDFVRDNGFEPVGVPDITDCLVGMQDGRYGAATGDDTLLAGFVAQDPNLMVVGDALTEEPYGIGVANGRVDLVKFINAELEAMRADGRWAEIYDRWLIQSGALSGPPPSPPEPEYGRIEE
jgi:polar amino acid transport system substrate-binding protein